MASVLSIVQEKMMKMMMNSFTGADEVPPKEALLLPPRTLEEGKVKPRSRGRTPRLSLC